MLRAPRPMHSILRARFAALLGSVAALAPKNVAPLRRAAKAFQFAGKDADTRLAGYFSWLPPE